MLFRLIFSVVEQDTGQTVRFRHIHGDGIDTITADGHRGQALGESVYLVTNYLTEIISKRTWPILSRNMPKYARVLFN